MKARVPFFIRVCYTRILGDLNEMTINHNLIFNSEADALEFIEVVFKTRNLHMAGSESWRFTQHGNVLIVPDKTFTRLDACGALDSAQE